MESIYYTGGKTFSSWKLLEVTLTVKLQDKLDTAVGLQDVESNLARLYYFQEYLLILTQGTDSSSDLEFFIRGNKRFLAE